MLTPEERAAIELRIVELTSRMAKLDHLHNPANIAEWGALYEAREVLDKLLGDDA